MKYKVITTNRFDKDVLKCQKRGLPIEKLKETVFLLESTGHLPVKYKAHKLTGQYAGKWECHIQPDWLLVWQQKEQELILLLTNTGSHSDLFKK